jgi:tripartite-type tricarboxylate transporter receptor subunit TctC
MKRFLALLLGAAALAAAPARAETFPTKPVHIVMPFLAGGAVDILARVFAAKLGEYWGQQVIVENRTGAGGNVGGAFVAASPPDGYMLIIGPQAPMSYNKVLYPDMPYDPATAFAPVTLIARSPNFVIVPKDSPLTSAGDIVRLAKEKPGTVYYGSQGNGTTPHLTGAMFALRAGVNMQHVPYRGFPPAFTDLVSGRITFMFADSGNTLPRLRDGSIKVLAIASGERWPTLPDVPTMGEAGYPQVVSAVWYAMAAPAKTPPELTHRIRDDMVRASHDATVHARLAELGLEAVGSTPEEMSRVLAAETERWGEVIRRSGVKVE